VVIPKMHCKRRDDKWWILGVPETDPEGCGPYDVKADAEEDMHGLERFYQHLDEPRFFTTDSRKRA
jgi:hypothetical protein